jgi:hypothetical protein
LIINDGSVQGGIPVKRIKAKDLVPSVIDVSYLRIQNRTQTTQGATLSFYTDSSSTNSWSGISASSFSAERVGGYLPSTEPVGSGSNHKPVIPVTNNYGLIPDSFVRLPLSFKLDNVVVPGFDATADVKSFDLSAGKGISMTTTVGEFTPGVVNAISYEIEALIPATGNGGPYGMNLFNINGYWPTGLSLSADARSLLSAHSGLSGGKGIKTNLTTRDVALPVRYIIPGSPPTTITYQQTTAVDIFTIAENPDDSNYVRKIGDVMTGPLTGTEASFTSLTATNGFIGTLTGTEASFTSLTATNGFIGTLTGVSSSFTSLTATNGFIGTLTGTEASFTSLTAGTSFNFGPTSEAVFQDAYISITGNDSLLEVNVISPSDRKNWDFVAGKIAGDNGSIRNNFSIASITNPTNSGEIFSLGNFNIGGINANDRKEALLNIHGRALRITGPSEFLANELVTKLFTEQYVQEEANRLKVNVSGDWALVTSDTPTNETGSPGVLAGQSIVINFGKIKQFTNSGGSGTLDISQRELVLVNQRVSAPVGQNDQTFNWPTTFYYRPLTVWGSVYTAWGTAPGYSSNDLIFQLIKYTKTSCTWLPQHPFRSFEGTSVADVYALGFI